MTRQPPPFYGAATTETIEQHIETGRRWLTAAMKAFPGLSEEAALTADQLRGGPLAAATVYRYRADLKYTLYAVFEEQGRLVEFDAVWPELDQALTARRSFIPEKQKRTSARKVTDATEEEARALFANLKKHSLRHRNPNSIAAALFVLVAGHFGFRPVELLHAQVDGNILTLRNAKRRRMVLTDETRAVDFGKLHPDLAAGLRLLLSMIDHGFTTKEFASWQKTLAGQLTRACKRIPECRLLSLYSFRHISISSWAAAGLPPEEIARLCGHFSIRTAHTHYARSGVGHKRKAVVTSVASHTPDPAVPADSIGLMSHELASRSRPATQIVIDLDDMPVPTPRRNDRVPAMSSEMVRAGLERFSDDIDIEEVARRLQAANTKRNGGEATRLQHGAGMKNSSHEQDSVTQKIGAPAKGPVKR